VQDVLNSADGEKMQLHEEKRYGVPAIILSFEVAPLVLLIWRHVVVHHLLLAHLDVV
jgi:hypothetical protein